MKQCQKLCECILSKRIVRWSSYSTNYCGTVMSIATKCGIQLSEIEHIDQINMPFVKGLFQGWRVLLKVDFGKYSTIWPEALVSFNSINFRDEGRTVNNVKLKLLIITPAYHRIPIPRSSYSYPLWFWPPLPFLLPNTAVLSFKWLRSSPLAG